MTGLLRCFMRLGHVDTAHGMLEWMRRSGLQPNVVTYAALLTLPKRLGEGAPAAARLLERVRCPRFMCLGDARAHHPHLCTLAPHPTSPFPLACLPYTLP